jgi:hypothetical protein
VPWTARASTRTYPTKESKRAKTPSRNVSEQYPNSIKQYPKTTGKQDQTQKATGKTSLTREPENREGGSKTKTPTHGSKSARQKWNQESKIQDYRLYLPTESRGSADDAIKRTVRLSAPHAPGLDPELLADRSHAHEVQESWLASVF